LDLIKEKVYTAQGRIQDLEMERNANQASIACLKSHQNKTNERMRVLTGLVYEVSQSYLELLWLVPDDRLPASSVLSSSRGWFG